MKRAGRLETQEPRSVPESSPRSVPESAPRSAPDPYLALNRRVLDGVFGTAEQRRFRVRFWDGTVDPPSGAVSPEFTLVLRHPGALRSMLLPPTDRSVGEAYVRGEIDIEGELEAAVRVGWARIREVGQLASRRSLLLGLRRLPSTAPAGDAAREFRVGRSRAHTPRRDALAVRFHYDLGDEFFRLFLGESMVYSCAYFRDTDTTLRDAQREKLELICRKLRLRPGERLLDVGCGWGSLMMHAALHHGAQVVGITLSERQAAWVGREIERNGLQDRCTVKLMDYRDVRHLGSFQKVASVGMIEHVGLHRYPAYFRTVHQTLASGGLFLNHGIVVLRGGHTALERLRMRLQRRLGSFVQRYIFPDGELVPLSRTLIEAERVGFEVRDVESLREHYARTLRCWVERLEQAWEKAREAAGETTCRAWRFYMGGAAHLFAAGHLGVVQSLLAKAGDGGTLTLPATREDLYETSRLSESA